MFVRVDKTNITKSPLIIYILFVHHFKQTPVLFLPPPHLQIGFPNNVIYSTSSPSYFRINNIYNKNKSDLSDYVIVRCLSVKVLGNKL